MLSLSALLRCCTPFVAAPVLLAGVAACAQATTNAPRPITLDEYLNTTDIRSARIAPDGSAAVIGTVSPDWEHDRFRKTLWLWRRGSTVAPITQSGDATGPQWSPMAATSHSRLTGQSTGRT